MAISFLDGIKKIMQDSVDFSINFEGSALSDYTIDVREISPALLALADLIEAANQVTNCCPYNVRLKVKGSFKAGYFGVDLIAVQSIIQKMAGLFTGQHVTAAANLIALLNGLGFLKNKGQISLVKLIKWLRGNTPTKIERRNDKFIIEHEENQITKSIEVDAITGMLYQNIVVRQSLTKAIKPLEIDGFDRLVIEKNGIQQEVIEKTDLPFFEAASNEDDIVSDITQEGIILEVQTISFKEGNKWRFSDGARSFYADMKDTDFMARVNTGSERFGKQDVLKVDLRSIQTMTDNGLKIKYLVIRVYEHRGSLQEKLI